MFINNSFDIYTSMKRDDDDGNSVILLEDNLFLNTNKNSISGTKMDVNVNNSEFISTQGHSLFLTEYSNINVTNSRFINTTSSSISIAFSHFSITDSLFKNNVDQLFGGAFYSTFCDGTIISSNFTNNQALMGGAIANIGSNFLITQSIFSENQAEFGGVSLVQAGELTIQFSKLVNNNANTAGSSFYCGDISSVNSLFCYSTTNSTSSTSNCSE
eukprot:TRINITY_DN1488_c0_g1_i1.p1 TRINITY_DN1488_c0_g1~~TRINITY_DN1488_c0_g1_i1.p1  ORF type:complete len:215 (+),score=48.27 TRINITY_DN1488_c0_g1_i1:905-1549(+)